MLRVALTGGIATGKSFCLARFAALGVPVIDADLLARDAVAPGSPGLAAIASRFGPSVILGDGSLDRAALGSLVFVDRTARADLERSSSRVYRRINDVCPRPGEPLRLAESPCSRNRAGHDFDSECLPGTAEQFRASSRATLWPRSAAPAGAQWRSRKSRTRRLRHRTDALRRHHRAGPAHLRPPDGARRVNSDFKLKIQESHSHPVVDGLSVGVCGAVAFLCVCLA